jgi:hypothetical protein
MYRFAGLALALALAAPVIAADNKFDPDARARFLAPYLDDQTIAVGHVDVTRIDLEATLAKLAEVSKLDAKQLALPKQLLAGWLAGFTKAGGKAIYAVVSLADLPDPPLVVVPLEQGADGRALAALLSFALPGAGPNKMPFEAAEQRGQAVVAGSKAVLERFRTLQPTPRPEVAQAFAAAGDTTAQVLVLPTTVTRRAIEEILPTLPKELGGGPSTILTSGFLWAAFGVDLPPRLALREVIQSQDAAAARALSGKLTHLIRTLVLEAREPGFDKIAAQLTPRVAEDRLTLRLDEKELVNILEPLAARFREAQTRMAASNNLKQIGLALHNYHDTHGRFPAAASYDKPGKPLLSWRVHVLPFLEQEKLYKEFHLDEPWDSEHNQKLIARMPAVFRSSEKLAAEGQTAYLAPVGEATMFPGRDPVRIRDVTDGTSNTLLVVEANDANAVIWTRPDDLKVDPKQPLAGLAGQPSKGFQALFADGSVRYLPETIDPKNLAALFTRNGGEVVSLP